MSPAKCANVRFSKFVQIQATACAIVRFDVVHCVRMLLEHSKNAVPLLYLLLVNILRTGPRRCSVRKNTRVDVLHEQLILPQLFPAKARQYGKSAGRLYFCRKRFSENSCRWRVRQCS